MKAMRLWHGVRMRQVAARPDPDLPPRTVTLPASWDDRAAEALAALLPGEAPVSLTAASSVWITLVAARARQAGVERDGDGETLALSLQRLLHRRRAAPNAAVWRCEGGTPGFRLNVAAFNDATTGYDVAGFARAASHAASACRLLSPTSSGYEVGLTGLDDLLASAGVPYGSRTARDIGACLAALLRASVELALEGDQRDLLATGADWPAPPVACRLPGLAEAATLARARVRRAPGMATAAGVFPPGLADALLGVETGGIAPAFSPVRERHLTRAAQDRLAAAAMSPEAALAAVLVGDTPLPVDGLAAHQAMHRAIAAFLPSMPPLPERLPEPAAAPMLRQPGGHEPLPARHAGELRKVSVGGHRMFLRTADYADGRLGEIGLTLPRESAAVRGLAECFAQAVSLGLQHGVRLDEFVDAFALTRFGPAGVVEGDPDIDRATSVLDYVFRTLSATYLNRPIPAPEIDDTRSAPLLPLDLPEGQRRLRLVA